MDNTIKTFADGSEITAKQLLVACATGFVVGVGVRVGRQQWKNYRIRKEVEKIQETIGTTNRLIENVY